MHIGTPVRPDRASSRSNSSSQALRLGSPVRASVIACRPSLACSTSRRRASSLMVSPEIPAITIHSSAAPNSVTG